MLRDVLSTTFAWQEVDADGAQQAIARSHQGAIERVIEVMRKQFAEPLSLNDMADVACLSPYYFNRVFHRAIGLPPCEFLAALRLDAAKRLLLTTELSVTDICFAVGYNALGSFTSRFTQQIGFSPRHLRLQMNHAKNSYARGIKSISSSMQPIQRHASLTGHVDTPGLSEGLIYIGVFPKPIPQGKPISCTMLTAPGPFRLGPLPAGWYYLMAAAFPLSADPRNTLLPGTACLVGVKGLIIIQEKKECPAVEICLRAPRFTDPPILTALL